MIVDTPTARLRNAARKGYWVSGVNAAAELAATHEKIKS